MKFAVLIAALFVWWSAALCAEGQEEKSDTQPALSLSQKKAGEKIIDIFILIPAGEKADADFIENFHLPSQTNAFFWASFRIKGKTVAYDSDFRYSTAGKKKLKPSTGKGYTLYGYSVRIRGEETAGATAKKTYSVTCTADEVLASNRQPASYILEKTVQMSKKTQGMIRIQSLAYASGTFTALVEMR